MSSELTKKEEKTLKNFFWCMIEQARWTRWKSLLDSSGDIIGDGALDTFKASIIDHYLTSYQREYLQGMIVFAKNKVIKLFQKTHPFVSHIINADTHMALCWEAVARGKTFYKSVNEKKLLTMYKKNEYLQFGFEFISGYL